MGCFENKNPPETQIQKQSMHFDFFLQSCVELIVLCSGTTHNFLMFVFTVVQDYFTHSVPL